MRLHRFLGPTSSSPEGQIGPTLTPSFFAHGSAPSAPFGWNTLDHLILKQAHKDGHIGAHVVNGNGHEPGKIASPAEILLAVFYGDAIHWGSHRSVIENWHSDHPFWAMKREFDAVRAAVQFGHLYVMFAAVVGLTTGELQGAEV